MASETHEFDVWRHPSHDGALRCLLCADPDAADADWCAATGGLVCDGCCLALLHGELARLFSYSADAGRVVTPGALFEACSQCDRAHRHATETLLREVDDEETPLC
jgi:hypothetical protein